MCFITPTKTRVAPSSPPSTPSDACITPKSPTKGPTSPTTPKSVAKLTMATLLSPLALSLLVVIAPVIISTQLLIRKIKHANTKPTEPLITLTASTAAKCQAQTEERETLNVMTYNIAGLAPHVNVNPPIGRIREFFVRLSESEDLPDVICFQESFAPQVSAMIKQYLGAAFPHMVINPIASPPTIPLFGPLLVMNSGLAILSKHPITFTRAIAYKNSCGADFHANKGAMAVGIEPREGMEVVVFTTHMQADPGNDPLWWFDFSTYPKPKQCAVKTKAKQLQTLGTFMRETLEEHPGATGMLCGDLNVEGETLDWVGGVGGTTVKAVESDEHKNMMRVFAETVKGFATNDCYRDLHPLKEGEIGIEEVGVTLNGLCNKDCNEDEIQRLDYVLTFTKAGETKMEVKKARVLDLKWEQESVVEEEMRGEVKRTYNIKDRMKCFSDHSAVIMELSLLV